MAKENNKTINHERAHDCPMLTIHYSRALTDFEVETISLQASGENSASVRSNMAWLLMKAEEVRHNHTRR